VGVVKDAFIIFIRSAPRRMAVVVSLLAFEFFVYLSPAVKYLKNLLFLLRPFGPLLTSKETAHEST
jgi:hypothetical protein